MRLEAPTFYDSHMHTKLCRHALGEPEEYAGAAESRHLKGIIITCHNPLPNGYSQDSRMYPQEFPSYAELVQRARRAFAGRVDVRLGLECDYVPGMEAFLAEQVRSLPFDYLIGSVHPHVREYRAAWWHGDPLAFYRVYYEHLALSAETHLFDCISHPDVVKNVFPEHWDLRAIMPDIRRCLDRIAQTGVAMEINTSGLQKEISEMNPAPQILREMRQRDIPVVVGSDAHEPQRVGEDFERAFDLLEQAGYQQVSFFLERRRGDVDISAARRSLRSPTAHRTGFIGVQS